MSETDIPSNNLVLELKNRREKIVFNPIGMRVLAIDANVVSLAYLVAILRKCKYNVTSTTKAEEALEILRNSKEKYDLVITDVVRLDMDGFRLLEIVSLEMDVPVILVTAEDNKSSIMKGIRHGASHYLLKPVRIQEIKSIWQHVLRKRLPNIEKSSIMRETKSEELKASENLEATLTKKEDGEGEGEGKEANIETENNSLHQKRPRLRWTQELHSKFVNAVQQLGDVLHPTKIMKIMNDPGLTRDQVASHLQKYKMKLKEEKEEKEKTSQLHSETQQWMMPHDLPVPEFKELKFSSTFLSPTKMPDEYMRKSSVSLGYNVHRVPAASSSFPFCSSISNASLNAPPQVPEQAPVKTGAILQHAVASGHGREKEGYFINHPSYSRRQFNDYAHNVQYPTLIDSMKNNEWNFDRHPCEKSHVQSSFHHTRSSPSYDDLTELVQQFANDQPPEL